MSNPTKPLDDRRQKLVEYCSITGRPASTEALDLAALATAFDKFVALTSLGALAPPAVLVASANYEAFHLNGDWAGICIDRRYLSALAKVSARLTVANHAVEIAQPVALAIADLLAEMGSPGLGLMLRHERLSALYALDEMETCLNLAGCEAFLEDLAHMRDFSEDDWREFALGYAICHELGHWLLREYGQEDELAKNYSNIERLITRIRSAPPEETFTALKGGAAGYRQRGWELANGEHIVEESFCDRFVAGVFLSRFADDRLSWRQALMTLRCLQEANRIVQRARVMAHLFHSERSWFFSRQTAAENAADRSVSNLHLRDFMASVGFGQIATRIYADSKHPIQLDEVDVDRTSEEIVGQSIAVFTKLAGPPLERCLSLLLQACAAKAKVKEVMAFYDRLALRYKLTHPEDVKLAFEQMVDGEDGHKFGVTIGRSPT